LTNIQAAIGCAQLKAITKIISERKKIYHFYSNLFKNIDGLKLQIFSPKVKPVMWTFAIVLDPKAFINRDIIIKIMKTKGIETRNGFYSPNRLPLYRGCNISNLRYSEILSKNIICLPLFTSLKEKEMEYIAKTLLDQKR